MLRNNWRKASSLYNVLQKSQWLKIVLSLTLSTGWLLFYACIIIIESELVALCCRSVLDFDFEKLCSVSLSNINVYACLVCGKYFQGNYTCAFYTVSSCL